MKTPQIVLIALMAGATITGMAALWYHFPTSPIPIVGLILLFAVTLWVACVRPWDDAGDDDDDDDGPRVIRMTGS